MPKKQFILRLDEGLLKALEKWASDEFRSTNGQVEYLLTQALRKAGRLRKELDVHPLKAEHEDPEDPDSER